MKKLLAFAIILLGAVTGLHAGACPYIPNATNVGTGVFERPYSTRAKITVDTPYEHGTIIYNLPAGTAYSVGFKLRKFGNPIAAQMTVAGQTKIATSSWVQHSVTVQDMSGTQAVLHTITYGSYGGVEIDEFAVTILNCNTSNPPPPPPPPPNPWVQIPLTLSLLKQYFPNPVTSPNPGTDVTILSPSQFKLTSLTARPNLMYIIDVEPGYEYRVVYSMNYNIPHGGGESGIYPDGQEYYSATNCNPADQSCVYGTVAINLGGLVTYAPNNTVFTHIITDYILFRSTILPNVAGTNGKGMTVSNFQLYKRLR